MHTQTKSSALLFERIAQAAGTRMTQYLLPLLASLALGLLAHGYAFANKLVIHDEVYNLFGKGATVDSGRWGLGTLDSIFPNYSMPWIYGILTVLLIGLAVCLMVNLFSIRSKVLQVLLAGYVLTFPSLTGTFAFMYTSSSYAVAFLLAVLSVWLLRQKSFLHGILGLGCGIFSVSIYQAYIALMAGLLVLLLIQELLSSEELLGVIRRGILYVGFLAAVLGLYYAATQLILMLRDISFNDYAGDKVTFSLASLPGNIFLAYQVFFACLNDGECALVPTQFSSLLHWACLTAAAVLLVLLAVKRKMKLPHVLLLIALIGILPLAINCMFLFTSPDSVHTLVLYGFVAVYLLVIVVAEAALPVIPMQKAGDLLRRAGLNLAVLCLGLVIVINTYLANEAYLGLHLQYENTYAFYSSLMADIKQMPEFDEDTKLAIIGRWEYPDYFVRHYDFTYHLFGFRETSPSFYPKDRFLEYYMGFPIPMASDAEIAQIQSSDAFSQMAVYPYYGSMQMFENVLVVKLS